MDPGSSAPSRPHPRSPAYRFACTHPFPQQTDTADARPGPRGPAHPGQTLPGAQEEPGTAGLCTSLELRRWKQRVSSLLPSQHFSMSSRSFFPGMQQHSGQCSWGWALAAAPPALTVAQPSRQAVLAGAAPACWGSTEPAQPPGTQCPQPCGTAASPEHRPPRPVFHTGGAHLASSACPQLLTWLQLGAQGRG